MNDKSVSFSVSGMTCASCASRIERVLIKIPEIQTANVNLTTATASVILNSDAQLNLILEFQYNAKTISLIKDYK